MTRDQIQLQLREIFAQYLGTSSVASQGLVPPSVTDGKLYEAHVLGQVVKHLVEDEGYSLVLVGGKKIQLKTSPGPINRNYPRIELRKSGALVAELWTDVEFLSLSFCVKNSSTPTSGDFHELDILIVDHGLSGRPRYDAIWLGVECKNTGYAKNLLREILGVRREMSLLTDMQTTRFKLWPRAFVRAEPASCLLVYSSDPKVQEYSAPGEIFGIDFVHEPT